VIASRLLRVACTGALAAGLALAGCRKQESEEPQPVKGELPVEQTPVSSIYEQEPGILYERPARTPSVSPSPAPTPSPSSSAPRASEDKPGRGSPSEASAKEGKG
jgi:hypothetical protein